MHNGCILNGGVGTGKSITSIAYYVQLYGGDPFDISNGPIDDLEAPDLYIITTARKRDTHEWEDEADRYFLDPSKVHIDSWNNIKKYVNVVDCFFIFDEDRVVGYGAWTKAFIKITKQNNWILLSATPGDCWMDYMPVFIANGFFKNKTEFTSNHCVYNRMSKFPKIDRYINTNRLIRLRDSILVDMDMERHTKPIHENIYADYDIQKYKACMRERFNPYTNEPFVNPAELCYTLRRISNEHESRQVKLLEILEKHPKAIIFYNFDYELDILKTCLGGRYALAEWNGHKHQEIPEHERDADGNIVGYNRSWVYLVQYTAGAEGWNCIKTDTIIFFSQTYSYKQLIQSEGRIDRLNTPFENLYYYHLKSRSSIDIAIGRALANKKNFNEGRFLSC